MSFQAMFQSLSPVHVVISLATLIWASWRFLRSFVITSPIDNIPGPPSTSFLTGVMLRLFSVNARDFHEEIAHKYASIIKIKAFFGENLLYVFDSKAMYHILVKDQHVFEETKPFIEGNRLLFGPGLLSTHGIQHRKQRKLLNPVFAPVHLREMTPTFYKVAYKLCDAFAVKVKNGAQEIEILSWMTRTALELIGQSGLGHSFEPLTEDGVPHPYSISVKKAVPLLMSFDILIARLFLLPTVVKIGTPKIRRFFMNLLPWKALHELRDISDVLHQTSLDIYESKKKALEEGDELVAEQVGRGKDIISILMRENMKGSHEDSLSKEELLAQMSSLTFGAMETTSSALARTLYLLATHRDAQDKLRQEIIDAKFEQGDLSYDKLHSLPYLDAICRETLRLYPPVIGVQRTATQDIFLPLSNPIRGVDGQEIREVAVPKNTIVYISILNSNCNREIWGADCFEWKPERWINPLPTSVVDACIPGIYSHLMTFIAGSRSCIGFKFSQLEMKVVLSLLIESFKFSPSQKEIHWHGAVAIPTVVDGGKTIQLPIIVEAAEPCI